MPIKTDPVNGRDLKIGSVFIPAGEKAAFYKVFDINVSKPGKHGSAKSLVSARNIINGKTFSNTYLDSSEKVSLVLDFSYVHKVVYDKKDTEILVNMETGECIYIQSFIKDDQERVEAEFKKFIGEQGLTDAEGSPLVIKYSETSDDSASNSLVFWELMYVKPEELSRYGISDYLAA